MKPDDSMLFIRQCCLHQIFRPESKFNEPGVGDCTICKPSVNNCICKKYVPVSLYHAYYEKKDDDHDTNRDETKN
jgi:hypothetical protein